MAFQKAFYIFLPKSLQRLARFFAGDEIEKDLKTAESFYTYLIIFLLYVPLVFTYTFITFFYTKNTLSIYTSLISFIFFSSSLFLYRKTNNNSIPPSIGLFSTMLILITYITQTGGLMSPHCVWFFSYPLCAGLFFGSKGILFWGSLSLIIPITFYFIELNGIFIPKFMSQEGRLISQFVLIYGSIYISIGLVSLYLYQRKIKLKIISDENEKFEELFKLMFHDLSAPIGRISLGLSSAKKSIPEGNKGFEIAQNASISLIEILDNFRDLYLMGRGKKSPELIYSPLESILDKVLDNFETELNRKKIKIEMDKEKFKGWCILSEPVGFINHVLGNVLSNAIKFSNSSSQIKIRAYSNPPNKISIEIKDQGIGIPKNLLKDLFNLEKRVSRPGTHGEAGNGIGLHIIQSLIELYGGEISIISNCDNEHTERGTVFTITVFGETR